MKTKIGLKAVAASLLITIPVTTHAGGPTWPDLIDPPTPWDAAVLDEGYLDVTKAPYNMDNDGGNATSNTSALQDAIDFAYQYHLIVFFPAGTYDVNNTLELFQTASYMTQCHALVGSAAGARPVVRLQGSNFDDAGNPKALFHFYCSDSGNGPTQDPTDRAASAYNMLFRGIDVNLNGRAGAVAIDMHAAQGSTIQDVKITATGAYAGVRGGCGSGTMHANIHIEGGKFGFWFDKNRPMVTLVGITCIGQTTRAIELPGSFGGPLTIVGFKIEAGTTNAVFNLDDDNDDAHLSLADGSIEFTGPSGNAIYNENRSVYLRNVYCKNTNNMVKNIQGANLGGDSGWKSVGDYNYFHVNSKQLIDGSFTQGEHKRDVVTGTAPPADLISRHLWDEATFPHFEGTAIFVSPSADDTTTINTAIADAETAGHNTVFLEKGHYYIDDQIHLKKDTKLVGVARHLTRIHCDSGWSENDFTPMVTTPDAANGGADATCMLAWLCLHMPTNYPAVDDEDAKITWLDWTAGRHSMVREVHFKKWGGWNPANVYATKRLQISGSGGGRWYSVWTRAGSEQGQHPEHRQTYVTGTTEPLSFYAFTVEYHESGTYMTEVNDCENVSFYGYKCETDISTNDDGGVYNKTPALGIVDSQNIIVLGQGGHADLDENDSNSALFEIVGASSDDIQIANATGGWKDSDGWGIVRDMYTAQVITKQANGTPAWDDAGDPCALYSIGDPQPIVYSPPSGGGGGGGNLLGNGDFETGSEDPYASQQNFFLISGYNSSYAAEITATGSWRELSQTIPVSAGTEYTLSGVMATQGAITGKQGKIQVRWLNSTGGGIYNDTVADISTNTSWTSYSGTFTAPAGAVDAKVRVVSNSIPSGGWVRIDNLVFSGPGGSAALYENDGSGSDPTTEFTHINGSHMNEFSYTGGKLDCSSAWKRIKLTAADAANWTDYTVEVDIGNVTNGPNKEVGCLLVRCGSGENYYMVTVDANDTLYIGKKAGGWTWTNCGASGANHSAYTLSVDVSGSSTTNIDVYVNGTLKTSYSDSSSPHTTGGIGFENRNHHSTYDNIVVNEL